MKTSCQFIAEHQVFDNNPQFISAGLLTGAVATVGNATAETNIFAQDIPAGLLSSVGRAFRLQLAGLISSDGSRDATITLRYGTSDILEVVTVSLPDEDDKAFNLEFVGRILTAGASGKVVASGKFVNDMTGMAELNKSTALAGASVDLTAAGTLNVSVQWDGQAATATMSVHTALLQFFN